MSLHRLLTQLHNSLSKHSGIIMATLCLFLWSASAFALYDVQTAQGVGLYLSMQLGISHTAMVDILCNAAFLLAMLVLILLPCFLLKHHSLASILRFSVLYLSFIPAISTAYLMHLADGHALFTLHPANISEDIKQFFTDACAYLLPLLQLMLPMLILLYGCHLTMVNHPDKDAEVRTSPPVWHKAFLITSVILLIPVLLFPELTPVSEYIIWYLLLVICFDLWEGLLSDKPRLQSASHIMTALLILRSIYRLLELMSHFKL